MSSPLTSDLQLFSSFVLPVPPGAQRQCQPLAVAALLDIEGLALLASDDLLSRFAQLCPTPLARDA